MILLKPLADNYNSYPRTMIRLCEISYLKLDDIPAAVQTLGLELVWGPAELRSLFDVSYSLMYLCRNSLTDEYMVVVRGTDLGSLESWIMEDFDIDTTQPFDRLAPHAPADALIAQGTFNGMQDLLQLSDPNTSLSAVAFLQSAKPTYLYVTGHSLGGTLSPPMFACLNDLLYGGGFVHNMALWTFAGLTPGGNGFNAYFNSLSNPGFPWRLHNTLDIAPFCWWSPTGIENIYQPYGLKSDWLEDVAIQHLFVDAARIGYTQPAGDQALAGQFEQSIIDKNLWLAQAAHQHASATYRILVDQAFPLS